MLKSFNCLNFVTTVFRLSSLGKEVLNKSPAMRIKSTFSFMHLSTALQKAKVLVSLSFGSLQEPMWQSARWANFMDSGNIWQFLKVFIYCSTTGHSCVRFIKLKYILLLLIIA